MKKITLIAIVIASTFFSATSFAQQTYTAHDIYGNRIDSNLYYSPQEAQAAARAHALRQQQAPATPVTTGTFEVRNEKGILLGTFNSNAEAQLFVQNQNTPSPAAQQQTLQQPAEDPYLVEKKRIDLEKDKQALIAMRLQNGNSKITMVSNGATAVGNVVGTGVYVGQQFGLLGRGNNGRNQMNRCQQCASTYVGTQHICANQNYGGNGYVVPPNSGYNGSYCQICHQTYSGGTHVCGGGYGQQTQGCFCTYYQNQGWVPNGYGTGTWCTWRMNSNGAGYGWFPSTQQGYGNNQNYNGGYQYQAPINRFDNGGQHVPGAQYGVKTY